jgi:hypothetical protein
MTNKLISRLIATAVLAAGFTAVSAVVGVATSAHADSPCDTQVTQVKEPVCR